MNISKNKLWTFIVVPIGGFLLWGVLDNILGHYLDSISFYNRIMLLNPQNWFRQFYLLTVPVWKILLFLIILVVLFYLFLRNKIIFKPQFTNQELHYKHIDKFKFDHRYITIDGYPKVEFKIDLDFVGNNVTLRSSNPYCKNHNPSYRMVNNSYPTTFYKCLKCDNTVQIDQKKVHELIVCDLENEWEKSFQPS